MSDHAPAPPDQPPESPGHPPGPGEVAPDLEAVAERPAETPVAHHEPAAAHDEAPVPAQVGHFDTATWSAVALGVAIGLLVALAFLAAGSRSF